MDIYPFRMYSEQSGTLLVFSDKYQQYPLIRLICSSPTFPPPDLCFRSWVWQCDALCYVPSPRQAEDGVVLLRQGTLLRAVSLFHGGILWEVQGEEVTVNGRPLDPRGVVYSPRHTTLLVCDGSNQGIVVLEPESGKVREAIQFDRRKIGGIADLCLCGDHAVMLHDQTGSSIKITFLDIK